MYYKAKLTDKGVFSVDKISDEEAYGCTNGLYGYVHGKESGTFAIRKTRKGAINAIWKSIQDQLLEHEKMVEKLSNIMDRIGDFV